MALTVMEECSDVYTVKLYPPETDMLRRMAKCFGMPKEAVLSSCLGKGITEFMMFVVKLEKEDHGSQAKKDGEG